MGNTNWTQQTPLHLSGRCQESADKQVFQNQTGNWFPCLGVRPRVVSEEGKSQRHPEPSRPFSQNGFGTAAGRRFVRGQNYALETQTTARGAAMERLTEPFAHRHGQSLAHRSAVAPVIHFLRIPRFEGYESSASRITMPGLTSLANSRTFSAMGRVKYSRLALFSIPK